MQLFADENVSRGIVVWLRQTGHDVLYAAEAGPGQADAHWLRLANDQQRLILTADKDFGELIFRDQLTSFGVILLRLDDVFVGHRASRLQAVWSIIEANPLGKFIVVTATRVRVRPLPP